MNFSLFHKLASFLVPSFPTCDVVAEKQKKGAENGASNYEWMHMQLFMHLHKVVVPFFASSLQNITRWAGSDKDYIIAASWFERLTSIEANQGIMLNDVILLRLFLRSSARCSLVVIGGQGQRR